MFNLWSFSIDWPRRGRPGRDPGRCYPACGRSWRRLEGSGLQMYSRTAKLPLRQASMKRATTYLLFVLFVGSRPATWSDSVRSGCVRMAGNTLAAPKPCPSTAVRGSGLKPDTVRRQERQRLSYWIGRSAARVQSTAHTACSSRQNDLPTTLSDSFFSRPPNRATGTSHPLIRVLLAAFRYVSRRIHLLPIPTSIRRSFVSRPHPFH